MSMFFSIDKKQHLEFILLFQCLDLNHGPVGLEVTTVPSLKQSYPKWPDHSHIHIRLANGKLPCNIGMPWARLLWLLASVVDEFFLIETCTMLLAEVWVHEYWWLEDHIKLYNEKKNNSY